MTTASWWASTGLTVRERPPSPVGFWLDSYDYPRFVADVLDPLGPGGDRWYRSAAHDVVSDAAVDPPWERAPARAVVLVDGLFLHRDGVADRWDFSVFLDVPVAVTARRMAARDGTAPDPRHPSMRRYVDAQRIYVSDSSPARRATIVVDNTDVDAPTVVVAGETSGDATDPRPVNPLDR